MLFTAVLDINTLAENIYKSQKKISLQKLGLGTTFDNKTVVRDSDVIIVCTKPNVVAKVLTECSSQVKKKNLIISVALGVTTKTMEKVRFQSVLSLYLF